MAEQQRTPQEQQGGPETQQTGHTQGTRYEGFEGMNYEQRRQPYDPQAIRSRRRAERGDRDTDKKESGRP